ncbi:MAG: helicase-exonuclease AddAB subunit AddA [Acetatifactor sp.]
MAVNFTPDQQKVIDLRDCNILVSAAAGSGKTAVLVERIVGMVCEGEAPLDIDRMLIVTFTNAAAAEMRERISRGIEKRLEADPENSHLQRQATLIHNAMITTIHSFCLSLLKNHFHEIGLDPAFRIADEGEIKLLRQEVLGDLMEEWYAEGGEDFRRLVDFFCPNGRDKVLEDTILELADCAEGFPWPEEWLEERKKDYDIGDEASLGESAVGKYLYGYLCRMTEGWIHKLNRVKDLCEEPDGPYMYGETVDAELEQLERLRNCRSLQDFAGLLPAISFGRLSGKKDPSVNADKRALASNLRGEVKESIQKQGEKFFLTPLELSVRQGLVCCAQVAGLIDLTIRYCRRLTEKKQEKRIIDFGDMEHLALQILVHRENGELVSSPVAKEYRAHFEQILIDEYQDSNLVQELILTAVSGEEDGRWNRFMVGDVKQSIYGFRQARPDLFLEKYRTYGETGDRVRIDLSRNFRSRSQVTDSVNQVFSRIMGERTGGLVYDDRAALYPGAEYPETEGDETELLLVEAPGKAEDAKHREAGVIARKILDLKKTMQVKDKRSGQMRELHYSDIVILLRSNAGWDDIFKKELEEAGVPAYITSKTGYFSASEVQELLGVLRVLDNPRQDIPLYGVLHSYFGGFSEEELAIIRSTGQGHTLYDCLKRYSHPDGEQTVDCHLQEKVQNFLETLERYRSCTTYLPVRELLTKIVIDFDYLNYVAALPFGGKRRANVEMLFTKASDFERTSYSGLFHFLHYMEQLEKYDVDYGEAELLDENADVVRIMSIHKSKGLEFPVTFVSGLNKEFSRMDQNRSLITDMDLGIGINYVDVDRRIKNNTLRRAVLAVKLREDALAEELRILYVAMTRPKEKMILTAACKEAQKQLEYSLSRPDETLSYLDYIESGSMLELLWPILGKTQIRTSVISCEEEAAKQVEQQADRENRRVRLVQGELPIDTAAFQTLQGRLRAEYPYPYLEGLYTKTTVSELKIAAMADRDEAAFHAFEKQPDKYIPAFRRKERQEVGGAARGSAYHRVMELLDFVEIFRGEDTPKERLERFLEAEVARGRLTEEYRNAVSLNKVVSFLETDLAKRMHAAAKAGKLYREQPFVLGISAHRLGEQFPEDEQVLIQGIIDVFFEEDGEIVLLDYKTDCIDSMEELWNRYRTQLDYYGEAVSRLMGMPVKESILYSFSLGVYE